MTPQDKREIIAECGQVSRAGLYTMVFLALFYSCNNTVCLKKEALTLGEIEKTLDRIEQPQAK